MTIMKRDPRYVARAKAMSFDLAAPVISHTDDEKASYFWSRYNEKVDPFVKYKEFWDRTAVDFEIHISHMKGFYKRYVLKTNGWSEEKFILVTNEIFERGMNFNQFSYDKCSKLYDNGDLDSQKRRRRTPERTRRAPERRRRRV